MANTLNLPLSGGGGSTGDLTFVGYFDTYALLPAVADADDLAYVRTTTGVFLINRNKKGVYRYTGVAWEFAGDIIQDAANVSYDNTTSGLVAATTQAALDEIDGIVDGIQAAPFCVQFARNSATTGNQWLRGAPDAHQTADAPLLFPFDVKLIAITTTTRDSGTWDVEMYTGVVSRAGGTPLIGSALAVVNNVAVDSSSNSFNVDIASRVEIAIYLRGHALVGRMYNYGL